MSGAYDEYAWDEAEWDGETGASFVEPSQTVCIDCAVVNVIEINCEVEDC